jgi:DNA-binding FadR family transcriptional regulator
MVRPLDGFTVLMPLPPTATSNAASGSGADALASTNSTPEAGRADWIAMPVRPIQSQRVYEQIAEQLTQLIRDRGLRPGDRLPPERELASQLRVSRPSVREAMIALETAGLVEVQTGSGTYVRALPSPGPFHMPWAMQQDAGPGVREQFEARKLVEPGVAALAAETITDAEIDQLSAAVARAEARFNQGQRAEEDDYAFHVSLAEYSRNTVLAGLVRYLWDLRRHEMWNTIRNHVVVAKHHKQVVADRRAIIVALRRRDAAAARRAMRHLLKEAERRYFG